MFFSGGDKVLCTGSPFRNNPKRLRKRYLQRMHPFAFEYVDGTGEGCRNGGDENRIAAVLELLDYEGRDERLFDLCKCRSPNPFVFVTRHAIGQAADGGVSRYPLEEGFLNDIPGHPPPARTDRHADQETDHENK